MGPFEYVVIRIDGDYAVLKRTDVAGEDTILVARALLPEETDEGTRLLWEYLEYTILKYENAPTASVREGICFFILQFFRLLL